MRMFYILFLTSKYIYIGMKTLKVKCTQYKISGQTTSKNARAMFSLKLGRAGNNFWWVSEISYKTLRGCPNPYMLLLQVCRRYFNVCPEARGVHLKLRLGIHVSAFWWHTHAILGIKIVSKKNKIKCQIITYISIIWYKFQDKKFLTYYKKW